MDMYDALSKKIKHRFKNFKLRYKSDYIFWRILPKKLRRSAMTFGNTIWMPSRAYNVSTLAHEYAHLVTFNKMGLLKFLWLYLQPQIFCIPFFITAVVLFIMSFKIAAVISLLAGIVMLMPWPSKERMKLEAEGYTMTLAVEKWGHGVNTKYLQKYIVDSLMSWLYYKMTWNRVEATKLVEQMTKQVNEESSEPMNNIAYTDTYEIFHNEQT